LPFEAMPGKISGIIPTGIGVPAVLVAVWMGVTVPLEKLVT
jgi:hypothetical protein